jgi:hypothetical protein
MEYDRRFHFNDSRYMSAFLLGTLATFYFFFYLTLGGIFCLYLSIFMLRVPLDQPRYTGHASQLTSRANPLSPGSSFMASLTFDEKQLI